MSSLQPDRRHRESRLRWLLRTYQFEIFGLAIVALGVFLIHEKLSIRRSIVTWLNRSATAPLHGAGRLGGAVADSVARVTLSDAIGCALVLGAVVAIVVRVRWRLMRNPALSALHCPQWDGTIHRVHRRTIDRIISLYVPVRRDRCSNDQCRWHGLRVSTGHGSSRLPARGPS